MRGKNLFCAVVLSALFLAGGFRVVSADAAQAPSSTSPSVQAAAPAGPAPAVVGKAPSLAGLSRRASMYYEGVWGVDSLKVKYTESGEILRFSYRIVDPAKAAPLNDKKVEPSLLDPQAGVKLVVPQMEKVGKLRQSSTPIAGQSYWMAFSNSGRRVKPGHRVTVEIGHFRAEGLVVE
jgi:hypothetical protein